MMESSSDLHPPSPLFPGGLHHGGLFKALIESAKKSLSAILGKSRTTDEELLIVVVEAEGVAEQNTECLNGSLN